MFKKLGMLISGLIVIGMIGLGLWVAGSIAVANAATPSGYCGPGFVNKKEAIAYLKTDAGKKRLPSMKKWLVKNHYMHADQAVLAFLESDSVVYVKTPKGFKFKSNTQCNGATYVPYHGRLSHSRMGALAVRTKSTKKLGKPKVSVSSSKVISTQEVQEKQADGSINVFQVTTSEVTTTTTQKIQECISTEPFQKAYCRNLAKGNKYRTCKTRSRTTTKKERKSTKKLVRTIPVPTPTPAPTPTPTPSPQPVPPSITITAMTSLNMIAAGKTSGPFHVTVNASQAGGSLTVDPGIGAVSRCDSTVPTDHVTFTGLTSGESDQCVILYAPNDADKPSSMTATFTAILGSAKDVKSDTFAITYPTRPE